MQLVLLPRLHDVLLNERNVQFLNRSHVGSGVIVNAAENKDALIVEGTARVVVPFIAKLGQFPPNILINIVDFSGGASVEPTTRHQNLTITHGTR